MDTDTDNKPDLDKLQDEGRLDHMTPISEVMEEHFSRMEEQAHKDPGYYPPEPEPLPFLGSFDLPDLGQQDEIILVQVRVKGTSSGKLRTTSVVRYQTGQLEVGFKIPPEAEVEVQTWKSEHDDRLGVALLVPLTL